MTSLKNKRKCSSKFSPKIQRYTIVFSDEVKGADPRVHFEVFTNYWSLKYISSQMDFNLRQCRLIELLKDYDISILYHLGKANVVAGALSRKTCRMRSLTANSLEEAHRLEMNRGRYDPRKIVDSPESRVQALVFMYLSDESHVLSLDSF
ncbi:hypothetical protein MTR67_033939 [Solanum verrucosum]|uniref:Uncharacterized protein n=1 Tax=Solanum verrucosum TaxID=315347 RepID=A0AAF0U7G9_SOLVR|nr:hypothetical protein MTR67_033939 [Solanum verrucosum]